MNKLLIGALVSSSFFLYQPFAAAFDVLGKLDQLAPMQKPNYQVGFKRTYREDGKTQTSDELLETIKVKGVPAYSWADSKGCKWHTGTDLFSPSSWWESCEPWTDGTQTYKAKGEAWPLKVGHEWKYRVKGSDANESWQTTRKCSVKEAVRVRTSMGEFDTFKVLCDDSWNRRTWYMSPELNAFVYFTRQKKRSPRTTSTSELVKLEGR